MPLVYATHLTNYFKMFNTKCLFLFLALVSNTIDNPKAMMFYDETIAFAKFNDNRFQIALDNVYQQISAHRNVDKGYMYLHQPDVKPNGQDSTMLHFAIGWRDENPMDVYESSSTEQLFFHCGRFAVLTNVESVSLIEHIIIGDIVFDDAYLDDLIHEDQELIALNSAGDTIIYQENWRPSSIYLHPTFSMDFIVCHVRAQFIPVPQMTYYKKRRMYASLR